jgi:hypothetical protein
METQPPRSFRELLDRYQGGERNFADSELDADPDNDLSGVCLDGANLSPPSAVPVSGGAVGWRRVHGGLLSEPCARVGGTCHEQDCPLR